MPATGFQVLGQNQDYWPEKVVERHMRDVKHPMISLSEDECRKIIDRHMEKVRKEREEREAARRGKAA